VSDSIAWALTAFSAIFFVIDPIAVVPIFLAMTPDDDDRHRASTARRAALIAAVVLVGFLFGGQALFRLFGVELYAFKAAGGVLLLLTALDQLRSHEPTTRTSGTEIEAGRAKHDISVVPLAMPLLAGPGAIATVAVFGGQAVEPWQVGWLVVTILVSCAVSWLMLSGAGFVNTRLGATGRAVLLRLSGLLLAAVGMQFMMSGIGEAFPALAVGR
jgi:multiple antibiotic resistance protein